MTDIYYIIYIIFLYILLNAIITTSITFNTTNKSLQSVKILKGRYITHGPPNNYKEFVKMFRYSKKVKRVGIKFIILQIIHKNIQEVEKVFYLKSYLIKITTKFYLHILIFWDIFDKISQKIYYPKYICLNKK